MIETSATGSYHIAFTASAPLPSSAVLMQNYPTPCKPVTTIRCAFPAESFVTRPVPNILLQQVFSLVSEAQEVGYRSVEFDAHDLSSGVFFYELRAGNFADARKLMLLKQHLQLRSRNE